MSNKFIVHKPLETAILFLVFNRLDTTKQVFNAIKEAKPPRLYIAVDGARKNKKGEDKKVQTVKDFIISNIDWECEVKTLFRDENFGCKIAVSSAIDWFFENEEMGIILEDDCLPKQSFFWYCEELLEKYKDDMRIGQISGRNNLGEIVSDYDYEFTTGGSIWGWATWRSRWSCIDLNLDLFENIYLQNRLKDFLCDKRSFDGHMNAMMTIKLEIVNSWAYFWGFSTKINNMLAIVPTRNMIKNIGFGSEATHTLDSSEELNEEKLLYSDISFPMSHQQIISVNRELSMLQDSTVFYENRFKSTLKKIPYLLKIVRYIRS